MGKNSVIFSDLYMSSCLYYQNFIPNSLSPSQADFAVESYFTSTEITLRVCNGDSTVPAHRCLSTSPSRIESLLLMRSHWSTSGGNLQQLIKNSIDPTRKPDITRAFCWRQRGDKSHCDGCMQELRLKISLPVIMFIEVAAYKQTDETWQFNRVIEVEGEDEMREKGDQQRERDLDLGGDWR